jgi:hypothetical protein
MTDHQTEVELFREALMAVLDAIRIPYPATHGDCEVYGEVLERRVMHAAVFIEGFLRDGERSELLGWRRWRIEYLREQLANNPPTGYRRSGSPDKGTAV